MTSVAAVHATTSVVDVLPDQTHKINLAKAALNVCIAVEVVATASLLYQIYENPSIMNPFSNERSFNPWSDHSVWFNKEHNTCIAMGLSQIAKTLFSGLIRHMEARQAIQNAQINSLNQNMIIGLIRHVEARQAIQNAKINSLNQNMSRENLETTVPNVIEAPKNLAETKIVECAFENICEGYREGLLETPAKGAST